MTSSRLPTFARALAAGLAFGACSASAPPGRVAGPTARFELAGDAPPNYLDVPFPTDAYLSNGKVITIPGMEALVPHGIDRITRELARLDGFGRSSFALFYVDDPRKPTTDSGEVAWADVDPASLPLDESACVADSSSVFLIDLAPSDPAKSRVRCRGRIHDDTLRSSQSRPVVAVGPGLGIVLEEGHAYAAVITSRVKDVAGDSIKASADFEALLSRKRGGAIGTMYAGAIDTVRAAIGGALEKDKSTIVAIAPFTTNKVSREMFALRESLESLPVPALAWDTAAMAPMGAMKFAAPVNAALPAGFTASLDDWLGVAPQSNGADDPDYLATNVVAHDRIAAIGSAVFDAVNFLTSKPEGYANPDHAIFTRDGAGKIVVSVDEPKQKIWVTIAVPKTPMPTDGYPCVIVAHGAPGSRAEALLALSNAFTAKGWLVAGIDALTFGARSPEPKYQVDVHTDWEDSPGAKYKGPDGLADNLDANDRPSVKGARNIPLDLLGAGQNFGAARDQHREVEIDISQLVRVLASNPDLTPLKTGATAPKIDASKIAYYGGSFGAITGMTAAAFEPKVTAWIFDAGGGQLMLHADRAASTQVLIQNLGLAAFGVTGAFVSETSPLYSAGQLVLDAYDPMVFADYLRQKPRNVLAIEVLYDDEVANDCTESWARAAGIGLAAPNVGPNSGVATLAQVRDPGTVPDRIPLATVMPDNSQLIHDTPQPGVTAVVVQVGPGRHYTNTLLSKGDHSYPVPYNEATPQLPKDKQFHVRQSYLEQEQMIVRFLDDAFAGKVPNVTGWKPAVRDFDDDGSPDATDPDPSDPSVK